MITLYRKSRVILVLGLAALSMTACGPGRDADTVAKTHAAAPALMAKGGETALGTDQSIENADLAAKVRATIRADPRLGSQDIVVEADDAAVTLSGVVDSAALRERAVQVAGSVEGVVQVQDRLELRS